MVKIINNVKKLSPKILSGITIFNLIFSQFIMLGVLSLPQKAGAVPVSTFTANQTVASVTVGVNDQTAVTVTSIQNKTETKASRTLTVGKKPKDNNTESITIGACVVKFSDASELNCLDNAAKINAKGGGVTEENIATSLRSLSNVSDTGRGVISPASGSGTTAIFATIGTESKDGDITFSDSTGGDITSTANTPGVKAVAQVNTITISGTVEAGDVFIVNLPGSVTASYTVTGGDTTTSDIATGLNNAIQSSAGYAGQAFESSVVGNVITLTAKVAGTGFEQSSSTINRPAVAQVVTFTPSGVLPIETYRATINGTNYDYTTGAGATVPAVTAALAPLIDADPAVDCTEDGSKITCTASVAGTEFAFSASVIPTHVLNYSAGENGFITGESFQIVTHGADGTEVTASPNPGYHFTNWSDGVLTASRTDTNVVANISVTANFEINKYAITVTQGANGTISPDPVSVNHGSDQTFAITPNAGYHVVDVTVDGSSIGAVTSHTFTNVVADGHTITASFAINTYTLTYTAGANGTIKGVSPQIVNYGEDGTEVTAVPNEGYYFLNWSDGVLTPSRTDTNVNKDIDVTANFTSDQKVITNFTIPGQVSETIIDEADHTIELTMPFGTNLTALVPTITITGASVSPASEVAQDFTNPVTYTVTAEDASTQDYTVSVAVAPETTVDITSATGGESISADIAGTSTFISLTGPVMAERSSKAIGKGTIILNAPAGFQFDIGGTAPTVLVTNTSGKGKDKDNINNLASGSTIPVSVSTSQLSIIITDSTKGKVTNSLTWQNVRVQPILGTPLATGNITESGTSSFVASTTNYGTLTEVVGAPVAVTVETAADGSGTIVPEQTLSNGGTLTVYGITRDQFGNFVANPNDTVWSLINKTGEIVDGDLVGLGASAVLTGNSSGTAVIHANNGELTAGNSGIITVSITHTLTYTAGENGSITGTTPQTVAHGADGSAVTAVANEGYHFVDWSDGSTANPRTDTNVTADKSVTANFEANQTSGGGSGGNSGGGGGGGGIAPAPALVISNLLAPAITTNSLTLTWTTNFPASSYVIYSAEGENHELNMNDTTGNPPLFGYAHATAETDTDPKVTSHSVTLTGLNPLTVYYFRTVSRGSLAISNEYKTTTPAVAGAQTQNVAGGASAENTGAGTTGATRTGENQSSGNAPIIEQVEGTEAVSQPTETTNETGEAINEFGAAGTAALSPIAGKYAWPLLIILIIAAVGYGFWWWFFVGKRRKKEEKKNPKI